MDEDIEILEKVIDTYKTWNELPYNFNKDIIQAIQNLIQRNKELENALIDMVNQFAYEETARKDEDFKLYTGGLSALENAFSVLDIDEEIRRKDLWKKIN